MKPKPFIILVAVASSMLLLTFYGSGARMQYILLLASLVLFITTEHKRIMIYEVARDPLFYLVVFFWIASILSLYIQYRTRDHYVDIFGNDPWDLSVFSAVTAIIYFTFGLLLRLGRFSMKWLPGLAITMIALLVTTGRIGFVNYADVGNQTSQNITHFVLSDATVLVMFSGVALSYGWRAALISMVGILLLFFIQGRAALYFSLLALCVPILLQRGKMWILITAAATILTIPLIADLDQEALQRMFLNASTEGSLALRMQVFDVAMRDLMDYIVLGDYNWSSRVFGFWGFYTHNALSYWIQYGFPVFVVFIIIIFKVLRRMRGSVYNVKMHHNPEEVFRLMMALYAITSVIFSKAFVWNWIWFAVGLYIGVRIQIEGAAYRQAQRPVAGPRRSKLDASGNPYPSRSVIHSGVD